MCSSGSQDILKFLVAVVGVTTFITIFAIIYLRTRSPSTCSLALCSFLWTKAKLTQTVNFIFTTITVRVGRRSRWSRLISSCAVSHLVRPARMASRNVRARASGAHVSMASVPSLRLTFIDGLEPRYLLGILISAQSCIHRVCRSQFGFNQHELFRQRFSNLHFL
mmetsp:Transcript_28724/g.66033  ORF Transcript_28724/g.66033 Transcript_28724/m.66033 type:complete len:165 (-) Transcript_28724:639-1133(-)